MTTTKVHFTGIPGSILKGRELSAEVENAAEKIATNARSQGRRVEGVPGDVDLPIKVEVYETDRARASVIAAHPAGLADQAKNGTLTRAAAEAGFEVAGS